MEANIETSTCSCNTDTSAAYHLDTLETSCHLPVTKQRQTLVGITLQKRVNVKNSLSLVDVKSPFEKKYWETWNCGRHMLQNNDKFHRKLCRRRWCTTCSRIRTAEYMNGYGHLLEDFEQPTYVVLTMQNCKGRELKSMYEKIVEVLRKARRNYTKATKEKPSGIWTFECTYNEETDTYHPHVNVVFDTYNAAKYTLDYWMQYWMKRGRNKVNRKAQSIQDLTRDEKALKEVFKYVTKHMTDSDNKPEAQDHIFRTIHGKRIVQPFGKLRKVKIEKPEEITDTVEGENRIEVWEFQDDTGHYENARYETLVSDDEVNEYTRSKALQKQRKRKEIETLYAREKTRQNV